MTTASKSTVYRLKDFYKVYTKGGVTRNKRLSDKDFSTVIKTFLSIARDAMIYDGKALDMGYGLGTLQVARWERNYSRRIVNWGESNKYKAQLLAEGKPLYNKETGEGYEWIIYHADAFFYGFYWKKRKMRVTFKHTVHNIVFYRIKIYKRAQIRLAAAIDELSPVRYEILNTVFNTKQVA